MKKGIEPFNCFLVAMLFCVMAFCVGCGTFPAEHSISTGGRMSPDWAGLKLYATDNVPFEYEEIGFICVNEMSRDRKPDDKAMCAKFRDKALALGADAVVNFRMDDDSDFCYVFKLTGVAVKIKKP